jgi:flagellar basal body-associated protein FliL
MSSNLVILIVIVAAAYGLYVWMRRSKGSDTNAGTPAYTPPASTSTTGLSAATATATGGALGSYEEYRRVSPSNMINGKLTCNRCGSNLIRTAGGMASCTTCGASLYRA